MFPEDRFNTTWLSTSMQYHDIARMVTSMQYHDIAKMVIQPLMLRPYCFYGVRQLKLV